MLWSAVQCSAAVYAVSVLRQRLRLPSARSLPWVPACIHDAPALPNPLRPPPLLRVCLSFRFTPSSLPCPLPPFAPFSPCRCSGYYGQNFPLMFDENDPGIGVGSFWIAVLIGTVLMILLIWRLGFFRLIG